MNDFPNDRLRAARSLINHVLEGDVPLSAVAQAIVQLVVKAAGGNANRGEGQ